jgi:type VI secretion system FHA domain protein
LPLHAGGTIPGDDLLPDDWDKDLLEGISSAGPTPAPVPPPRPVAPPPPQRKAAPKAAPPVVEPDEPAVAPPPPVVARRAARPPPTEPEMVADDGALLAAFLEGVGLRDAHPEDPPATMLALGKAFRNLVSGLRAVLIARAQIKSEFRIEQTMIQARGNNPLKFSAGDDDALAALLGTGRHTDMAPHEAVADALRDIRLHELASIAAMQTAVRALLDGLSPAKLRAQVEQGGGMSLLPAQKKARAWDAFEAQHARTVQALADDFDSVFGKAFARAYERSLRDVASRGRE